MIIKRPTFTSVIIPNFNGIKYLPSCLSSLKKQTFSNFEIIVVDNGSTDDSVEFIKNNFPEVRILQFEQNQGFAKAVNEGIKKAKGRYIALLNNDAWADENWLSELTTSLDKNPSIYFCASKILQANHPNKIEDAGDIYSLYGMAYIRGFDEEDKGQYDELKYIFSACAGAAIYRKELFEKIGFFDEDLFAYCEDTDLSFRAQLSGFKCLYAPKAIVYHLGRSTLKGGPIQYLSARNNIYIIVKNLPLKFILLNLHKILFLNLLRIITKPRLSFYILKGQFEALFNLRKMLKKRKEIQKKTKISDRELSSILDPHLPILRLKFKRLRRLLNWLNK